MKQDAAAIAVRAIASRKPQVFLHVASVRGMPPVKRGFAARYDPDEGLSGSIGSEAIDAAVSRDAAAVLQLAEPTTQTYTPDGCKSSRSGQAYVRVFLDPIVPTPRLIIAGAGHIAQPLARIAEVLGFEVWVVDDRSDYSNISRFPTAHRILVQPFQEFFAGLKVDPSTYVVLVTRAHRFDEDSLRRLLETPTPYIGMIGSRRRVHIVHKTLLAEGVAPEKFRNVYAPIGVDLGGRTAEEIALAIVAELVNLRRGGKTPHLSLQVFRHAASAR